MSLNPSEKPIIIIGPLPPPYGGARVSFKLFFEFLKPYTYSPIKKKERAVLKEQGGKEFVWVFQNNGFVEKVITLGINDNANFEIIDGVAPGEQLIVDTAEPDAMKEFFERLAITST